MTLIEQLTQLKNRLIAISEDNKTILTNKGVTVPDDMKLEGLSSLVMSLQTVDENNLQDKSATPTKEEQTISPDEEYFGLASVSISAIPDEYISTIDADAVATDMLHGKTAYVNGERIVGTIEERNVDNLTVSGSTVVVQAGYYENQVEKSIPSVAQAVPEISVDAYGTITVNLQQKEGYVQANDQIVTKQMTVQGTKTIVPAKQEQAAVAKSVYTTGAIMVAAIPDEYQDVSNVTAEASNVLQGSVFVDAQGESIAGAMPNNGDTTKEIDGLTVDTITIPAGYTSGGTISLTSAIADALAQI